MITIQIKHKIGENIRIKPLEKTKGRVVSIWIRGNIKDVQYEVKYFHNGQCYQVYFYGDEIE